MSEHPGKSDAAALWRSQPKEKTEVHFEQIVNRRTEELSSRTRSEVVVSIGAAALLAAVVAMRFANQLDRGLEIALAAAIAWIAITVYRLRKRIWPQPEPADATAVTGAEHYRRELEQRRDHLRDAWLWRGPLILACAVLIAVVVGKSFMGPGMLGSAAPPIVLLAIWTAVDHLRRRRQAREIQREIDELERPE